MKLACFFFFNKNIFSKLYHEPAASLRCYGIENISLNPRRGKLNNFKGEKYTGSMNYYTGTRRIE